MSSAYYTADTEIVAGIFSSFIRASRFHNLISLSAHNNAMK